MWEDMGIHEWVLGIGCAVRGEGGRGRGLYVGALGVAGSSRSVELVESGRSSRVAGSSRVESSRSVELESQPAHCSCCTRRQARQPAGKRPRRYQARRIGEEELGEVAWSR